MNKWTNEWKTPWAFLFFFLIMPNDSEGYIFASYFRYGIRWSIKLKNENKLITDRQTRAFILMMVIILVLPRTENILLLAEWFDNPFLFFTLKLQMNNDGRQQFFLFVTPSSHIRTQFQYFLCKIPYTKDIFQNRYLNNVTELFTYALPTDWKTTT